MGATKQRNRGSVRWKISLTTSRQREREETKNLHVSKKSRSGWGEVCKCVRYKERKEIAKMSVSLCVCVSLRSEQRHTKHSSQAGARERPALISIRRAPSANQRLRVGMSGLSRN